MGIRFQCPNGHKLNVKAELAGKRAICPDCGAKIVVPAQSNGDSSPEMAGAIAGGTAPASPTGNGAQQPKPSPATATPPPALAVAATPAPTGHVWYVRPSTGGQFGPAHEDVFRGWIAEGRVAADAHVWREGWPEWKLARDAGDALPAPLVATPIAPSAVARAPAVSAPPVGQPTVGGPPVARPFDSTVAAAAEAPSLEPMAAVEDPSPASRYTARRRRSKKNQLTLAVLMLLAVLLLAGILAWVVRRNTSPVSGAWHRPSIQLAQIVQWPYVARAEIVSPEKGDGHTLLRGLRKVSQSPAKGDSPRRF